MLKSGKTGRELNKGGMLMNELKLKATIVLSAIYNALGVLAIPTASLLVLNIIDYITGFKAAPNRDQESARPIKSYKSVRGIYKKVSMYLLIIVGCILDKLVGTSVVCLGIDVHFSLFAITIACWLCLNEVISILENMEDAEMEIPPFLMPMLKKIKKQINEIGETEESEDE